jgi:heat shock protein HslJ
MRHRFRGAPFHLPGRSVRRARSHRSSLVRTSVRSLPAGRALTLALLALVAGGMLAPTAGAWSNSTPTPAPTLTPVVWQWTALELADGTVETPDDPAKYTIQFLPDGTYLIRADCNQGSGTYSVDGTNLTIEPAITTLIGCPPGSLDSVYLQRLGEVVSFAYDEAELVLALGDNAGVLRFAPALTGVVWEWQRFEGGDGSEVVPDDPSRYTIRFMEDGTVAVQADCNSGSGRYVVDGDRLEIDELATTLIGCPPGSLGTDYLRYLDEAVSHVFREGKLYLALPADAGIAEFAATVAEETTATPEA